MPKNEKIKIEFTKEQYFILLKMAYMGNWLANAQRTGDPEEPYFEEYHTLEDYIFSFAKDFGFGKFVDDSEEINGRKFFPARDLEEDADIETIIEEYDEETFWDELFYRMSDRDFFREYSEKERREMTLHERFKKEEPIREKWDNEINEHGIGRLEVKEK